MKIFCSSLYHPRLELLTSRAIKEKKQGGPLSLVDDLRLSQKTNSEREEAAEENQQQQIEKNIYTVSGRRRKKNKSLRHLTTTTPISRRRSRSPAWALQWTRRNTTTTLSLTTQRAREIPRVGRRRRRFFLIEAARYINERVSMARWQSLAQLFSLSTTKSTQTYRKMHVSSS